MPGVQPPLPPTDSAPRWLLAILWLLPAASVLLMVPVGLYWMNETRGEKVALIFAVLGVIYIALLSVLAEINGRLKASTLRSAGRDPVATGRLHSRLYFVVQFVLGPLLVFLGLWVLALLGSR